METRANLINIIRRNYTVKNSQKKKKRCRKCFKGVYLLNPKKKIEPFYILIAILPQTYINPQGFLNTGNSNMKDLRVIIHIAAFPVVPSLASTPPGKNTNAAFPQVTPPGTGELWGPARCVFTRPGWFSYTLRWALSKSLPASGLTSGRRKKDHGEWM